VIVLCMLLAALWMSLSIAGVLCACREGQEVLVNDGRPNGELLLSTGALQDANMSDCLYFNAALLAADR
jgi:hypothetical protein